MGWFPPTDIIFMQSGLNEADTVKSSLILIYYVSEQSFYTQREWHVN